MKPVYLHAVGLVAPGLEGWAASLPVLCGEREYQETPLSTFDSELLPRNERRRLTPVIKLALQAGEEAIRGGGVAVESLRSVFASSGGDGAIIDRICRALNQPERPVSPTQFHNSVHNSPAGYWAIATQCRGASVSLSAHDASFAAGLLESGALAVAAPGPVLLVAYDHPLPAPLSEARQFHAPFAVALLIDAEPNAGALAALDIAVTDSGSEDCNSGALESLRTGNPAARSLPLLQAVARGVAGRVVLPYLDGCVLTTAVTFHSASATVSTERVS